MQYNITTSLVVALSENGFGLDELVYRMEELASKKAFPQLLKTIILPVDENIRLNVMLTQPLPAKSGCTCEHPDLVLDGGMPRKIRTRLGVVELPRITRVKCKHCGKTFVPCVTNTFAYDAMGCQIEAHDAAGTTTFAYDAYGALTNETVTDVTGTNTIERHWDEFGHTAGYALNGERQTTIGYDTATGRITSILAAGVDEPFAWSYLPGSDLSPRLPTPTV